MDSARLLRLLAALVVVWALPACPADEPGESDAADSSEQLCEWDDSEDAATAVALALDEMVEGFVCPVKDQDWYRFSTGPNDHLVTVKLQVDGELSPAEPTYTVWSIKDGEPDMASASPPPEMIGGPLNVVHCMEPGEYFLVVRDYNDDGQDFRRHYQLTVTSSEDPDPAEPNDAMDSAVPLTAGTPATGAIACRGDDDFYAVEVPDNHLVRIQFTADIGDMQPTVTLLTAEGETIVKEQNLAGSVKETDVDRFAVVPGGGTYYVVVSDDDGLDADPEVSYTIQVDVFQDDDPNEPNHDPEHATPLSELACGTGWSAPSTSTGTIGAKGDVDWFRMPVSGCTGSGGLVEAELTFDTAGMSAQQQWDFIQEIQASVTLVRADTQTPCTDESECQVLNVACNSNWDCAGKFNTCLPQGLCAGASACLPEGDCGANVIERHVTVPDVPSQITAPPPPNTAIVSAPFNGGDPLYLKIADYQSNGSDPEVSYTLSVRVRQDADTHEPSNVFSPDYEEVLEDAAVHFGLAKQVPVHDCVAGDCCGTAGNWVSGNIGYETDVDWYAYQHPCPGLDCMVRIQYEFDAGPVDPVFTIFRAGSVWFDTGAAELELQKSTTGQSIGGLGAGDRCFYAYQGHAGSPFLYYIIVNDRVETRDWSADQSYRFCVEKIADSCVEPPCHVYTEDEGGDIGCGPPEDAP